MNKLSGSLTISLVPVWGFLCYVIKLNALFRLCYKKCKVTFIVRNILNFLVPLIFGTYSALVLSYLQTHLGWKNLGPRTYYGMYTYIAHAQIFEAVFFSSRSSNCNLELNQTFSLFHHSSAGSLLSPHYSYSNVLHSQKQWK